MKVIAEPQSTKRVLDSMRCARRGPSIFCTMEGNAGLDAHR
jgi:hypothetical protein